MIRDKALDFGRRHAELLEPHPDPLDNSTVDGFPGVKCYRNLIYTLLFHTPVLSNYIDEYHIADCPDKAKGCMICRFRNLAKRVWAPGRIRDHTFNYDTDRFWREAIDRVWDWDIQQDTQKYMQALLDTLNRNWWAEYNLQNGNEMAMTLVPMNGSGVFYP
ncbi:hypothetical protein BGW36DRAFT_100268 [Talaromyces proteolyticus]|uniref:Peptidase C19 ubiquitin carboxyl-terminal hydrolase domain-containing protein n=1 Tax=Talaromyces proteolyticus TaxID=1131652 RepID=A0AAD4Q0M6_9EURO|nr:uncharacterized protein BGW36DRAFT_100268 [Talaromyces proteolyticus]KAH8704268.1 hypothetical protein BGW36DRAFT_100268 [Talaromyces proteolyticus]